MAQEQEKAQWALHVIVWHSPQFGHRLSLETQRQGRDSYERTLGWWKSIGIPGSVLTDARSVLDATFTEYLTTRYGIQDEIPNLWTGEKEPF